MTEDQAKKAADALIVLAENLSEPDYEVTATDVLWQFSIQIITEEDRGKVLKYLIKQ